MEVSLTGLPIIDFGQSSDRLLASQVRQACETSRCFYLKNHSVDLNLIDALDGDLREFFAQPLEYKNQYKMDKRLDRGYFPFESQSTNAYMGRRDLPYDPIEQLAFGPPYSRRSPALSNIYPTTPPTLKERVIEFYKQMDELAEQLARVFGLAVHPSDPDYFYRLVHDANHTVKAHWYPGRHGDSRTQPTRFAEHVDLTIFNVVYSDECRNALQLKKPTGEWVYVDPIPGTLFLFVGSLLQRFTNDTFKAVEHKVVWPENGDVPSRLSVVLNVMMQDDAVIGCLPSYCDNDHKPKYQPVSFWEYWRAAMNRYSNVQ